MPGKIEGKIAAYGPTGNLVTDIANDRLKGVPAGDAAKVVCDEHETVGIYPADHQEEPMTLMAMGLYNEPAGAWFPSVLY